MPGRHKNDRGMNEPSNAGKEPGASGPGTPTLSPEGEAFADLVDRVASARDRDAFILLFDHFAPRIKGYLVRQGADAEVADELSQEVMITLWRKAALFDRTKSSVSTWLYRIARNRRIDMLRRDKSGRIDVDDPAVQPEPNADPDEELDAAARERRIRAALTKLPQEQVDLIRLSFFKGMSHSQIAEETGLPLGTVKSRIRLAFSRLRRLLEEDAQVDPPRP